jgi:hypothetical protein
MRGSLAYDFQNDVNRGAVTTRIGRRRLSGPVTCEDSGLLP